jgi:hypothetical protein
MKKSLFSILISLSFFLFSPPPAQAYLDPGAGSYLIQIVVGSVLGAMYLIKTQGHAIKQKLSHKLGKSNSHEKKSPSQPK